LKEINLPKKYNDVCIIRPKQIKTKILVWIEIERKQNIIYIDFPEKRQDFKELVNDLGYRWDGSSFFRKLNEYTGSIEDRAAELGCSLLLNEFSVVFSDKIIQNKSTAGEYVQECKRWILVRSKGKYKDWFVIRWFWPEDCYQLSRSLDGSIYDKPFVVVPPEAIEEVTDFARINNFCFSTEALALAAQARLLTINSVTVDLKKENKRLYPINIPSMEWKNDDLEDNIKFNESSNTTYRKTNI